MIHKSWPDKVIVRREHNYWQICRLARSRDRDRPDVLQTELSRESCEAMLARKGYIAASAEKSEWFKPARDDSASVQALRRARASQSQNPKPRAPSDVEGPIYAWRSDFQQLAPRP